MSDLHEGIKRSAQRLLDSLHQIYRSDCSLEEKNKKAHELFTFSCSLVSFTDEQKTILQIFWVALQVEAHTAVTLANGNQSN